MLLPSLSLRVRTIARSLSLSQNHPPSSKSLRPLEISQPGPATTTMYKYISRDELAALIKSDKVPMKDYCVVDVRDDDFRGGNIRGAHNAPSSGFAVAVTELVQRTRAVPTVVFHCALSQARGPKAARIYAETREGLEAAGQDVPHEVLVLRGGFQEFQEKFRDDPALVENWDRAVWTSEYAF